MKGDNADHDAIEKIVKDAQRKSIKLPFIRQVVADGVQNPAYSSKKNPKKDDLLKKGQMIICDIVRPKTLYRSFSGLTYVL